MYLFTQSDVSFLILSISNVRSTFLEGDHVLLRFVKDETKTPVFTKPLRPGGTVIGHYGRIAHEALIGKTSRDIVVSSTGRELRVHVPTLEDYVTLTPRLVTPVCHYSHWISEFLHVFMCFDVEFGRYTLQMPIS